MKVFEKLLTMSEMDRVPIIRNYCNNCTHNGTCFECDIEYIALKKHYTAIEVAIAKIISNRWRWIARDINGEVYAYHNIPSKQKETWFTSGFRLLISRNFICDFPSVRWEDAEPTSLDEIRNYKE